MFKNYLKIALRNIVRQKVYAGINLLGLAIGLACTIVITLWIQRELSMNQFHEHKADLYRILEHQTYGDDIFTFSATPGPLAEKLKADVPEITHASRVTWGGRNLVTYGNQSFYEQGRYVEPDFLKMFTYPLLKGDPETALSEPNNILITEELAEKYFFGENPMGKSITLDDRKEYQITGILKNIPDHSYLAFDILMPLQAYLVENTWLESWTSNGIQTYFRAVPETNTQAINDKVKNIVAENGQENVELLAQPLADWYLRSDFKDGVLQGGAIDRVKMFGMIAFFILLIACINFMNLVTAKSTNRAKEVGVRKVMGADRSTLAKQFMSESIIMTVLSGLIGLLLVLLILPSFNQLFKVELSLWSAGTGFWISVAAIVVGTGILSGTYPSFFLSGFQPVKVLKKQFKATGGSVSLRKVLVTAQFVISIMLIVSTMVIYQQIQFIKNKNLGYNKENLLYIPANQQLATKYDALKTELSQLPSIASVSATSGYIHAWGNNTANFSWDGKDPETSILFQTIPVDYDFLATIGASLKDGRDFSPAFSNDSTNFVINERAAELMGMENPIGQALSYGEMKGQIVGWTNDFHVGSFRNDQDPVIMVLEPQRNIIYVRTKPSDDMSATLASLETVFKKYNPAYPFEYRFTDEQYEKMHQTESTTGELAKVFAFLAIFVSCLGLFGLAAFATEQRRREIGIRKVLGATVAGIVQLLSKDFLKLVVLAFLIATPLAWYFMDNWLQTFAYQITLEWWFFALAGFLAVGIAFFTVGAQGLKAAFDNPMKALKSE